MMNKVLCLIAALSNDDGSTIERINDYIRRDQASINTLPINDPRRIAFGGHIKSLMSIRTDLRIRQAYSKMGIGGGWNE